MTMFEIVKQCQESERYPALLAWFQYRAKGDGHSEDAHPIRWLGDESTLKDADVANRFGKYLEEGEIGAAQFLVRRYPELMMDEVIRRRSGLTQLLADAMLDARDALVQLTEADPQVAFPFASRLNALHHDPIQMDFRPGWAIKQVQSMTEQLQALNEGARQRVIKDARDIGGRAAGNPDVQTAVRRIEQVVTFPEGLATAAQFLGIANRAENGTTSPDDMRLLYSSLGDGARLIKPWSEVREWVVDLAGPAALAERLGQEEFYSALRLPGESDRDRLRDLFLAMSEAGGPANLAKGSDVLNKPGRVADALSKFLGTGLKPVVDGKRSSYGGMFSFRMGAARHREFSGEDRKLYFLIPSRGIDVSALSQFYRSMETTDGGKALLIVLFPGMADPERPLSQQLGINRPELPFLDCIDLLRMAQVPMAQRLTALQQALLPRMPSLSRRTYQTAGPVASALFRGRQDVIEQLTSPRGKTVLFSGRMMGKSSVLSRIREDIVSANPNGEHQCVLLSASLGALLEPLVDSLQPFLTVNQREESQRTVVRLASTDRDSPTQREEKVTKRLALLRQMIEKIIEGRRLTILIDEADVFSQTDSALERRQSLAWLLRDLEIHNPERLRVVFAGFQELHHEVIAANGAFANWFGQCRLGPLEREEAISLIKEPLADFGVQFVSDAGMERILEFTGRYPLLIQEVCSRLMERAMARRPHSIKPGDEILTVRAGEVEMVCRDESLRTRLHQVLSLNLDKYPRLKLVTYLILQAGTHRASASDASFADVFKIEDVQARLIEWYGAKLSEYFSEVSLPGMVDELESLGLVAKHGDGYRFLNRTFASMLRDNRAFESELLSLLMQVANPTDSEPRRYASLPKEHLESLLRSPKHSLLAGLRATLKTQTVKNLFSNELGTRSHLVNEGGIIDSKSLQEAIQKRLHETRKSLSLGDLCVRHGIEVLVLDCPDLTYQALEEIARELADRAPIRLVATATPEVTRQFVTAHSDTFQLLAMRRLRAKDIIAWAEQPYRRRDGKEAVLTIDENTAAALLKATCGYFPLLLKFREYCEREMVKAMAYYPKREDVTNFQTELTGSELKDILLGELSECERTVLRRLLDEALLRDGAEPHVESERIDTLLLEIAEDDSDAWGSMIDAVEVLRHLDLMTEQLPNYNLDNAGLLRQAFEA